MKKLLSVIAGILFIANSFAQINEGKIKYNVSFSSSDPAMQAQLSMLNGTSMTMHFSADFNRVEMNMGMFMTTKTIIDNKTKAGITLMDGMMGKKAMKIDNVTVPDEDGEEEADIQIEKTNDTKKIAGYKCTKYILTSEDGTANYWVTTELDINKEGVKYMNSKVEGFPLEFEMSQQGMVMTFTATEVLKSLKGINKKEIFSMEIPEGYELMSEDDLKKMGGM
ncbi:MAG TPA: DUF4412 domain-containing protein [Taishania sp.]|nr:DUF4412 domain-containing protein [Taishania sp.]